MLTSGKPLDKTLKPTLFAMPPVEGAQELAAGKKPKATTGDTCHLGNLERRLTVELSGAHAAV